MLELSKSSIIAITENRKFAVDEYVRLREEMRKKITSRSLVFSFCSNTIGSLGGYLSFIENSVVPVMLDASIDNEMLMKLINTYEPNYFWCPDKLSLHIQREVELILKFEGYVLLKNKVSKSIELNNNLALLLTTSGSTGSPKFVRLTYKNLEANAISIAKYLEISDTERPITSLPMHYSYGLSIVNSHLMKGATLLLTDRSIMEKEFWAFFRAQSATSIAGVPYTYQMLKRLRLQKMDLPSLRTLTQAGGKLSADLVGEYAEWASSTGRRFFVMYGQTEATARMSYLPSQRALEKSASIGIAIPGGEFYLIDTNNNNILTPNTPGELLYRGDNVSMGYAEHSGDLAKGDENEGILRTGDIAQYDTDGFYYIVGRLKRFVKIFGNRISLDQVEQLARELTPDCACTGIDECLIVHITDSSISDEMRSFISRKTGLHQSAIMVNVVSEIPQNNYGKIQYSHLG